MFIRKAKFSFDAAVAIMNTLLIFIYVNPAAIGAPMDPGSKPPPGNFSASIMNNFSLFADSDSNSIVYYIPKTGNIAVLAPHSTSPRPRFSSTIFSPLYGIFAGERMVSIGGSFSTNADFGSLSELKASATQQGLILVPAPIKSSKTEFLLSGTVNESGRVDVKCKLKYVEYDGQLKPIPECFLKSDESSEYDIITSAFYKFASLVPARPGSANNSIPFQAIMTPWFTESTEYRLMAGEGWDDLFQAYTRWELETERKSRKARISVNWNKMFERAEAFMSYHNGACIDIEVQAFFEKQMTCKNSSECAIRTEFLLDSGVWTENPPSDSDFIAVVSEVQKAIQDQVWQPVNSQLDRVSTKKNPGFILRANYQKITRQRNETIPILYNPGKTVIEATTVMSVSCLISDGLNSITEWNMFDNGCRSILGHDPI